MSKISSPIQKIEPRLRPFLPADLYVSAWVDPSPTTLEKVFGHLRTLQRILYDYSSRHLAENPPQPGVVRQEWQRGTLIFTDLAGFTRLMEANAKKGQEGAASLLKVLNNYFADMIEIVSKSGGDLLEFTGDALLILFHEDKQKDDLRKAVRAGLRMQRAMSRFEEIETPQGNLHLGMRVGIHRGKFLAADVGTPRRMEHILLGSAVQEAKLAEGAGKVGRVCLTESAFAHIKEDFDFEEHISKNDENYKLVIDNFSDEELGEYEIDTLTRKRLSTPILLDRSVRSLVTEITQILDSAERLASFIPSPVLNLLVESAAKRHIRPDFPTPTVVFVNLVGLPELVDRALPGEELKIVNTLSKVFARINAAVESRGGVLKKVTYHISGSDMVIYFGVLNAHTNDQIRAASVALEIRKIIENVKVPSVGGLTLEATCQIGINFGSAFAAEVGEPHGRREFNLLSDTVNVAARLMDKAEPNQILLSKSVHEKIKDKFSSKYLADVSLKGKGAPVPLFELDENEA